MQKLLPIALLAVIAVGCKGGDTTAATGGGGAASPDKTYTFKFNPKQGEKYAYLMTINSEGKNIEQMFTIACEKAEADKFTMVTTFDGMKVDGKDLPAAAADSMKAMKMTAVMDSTGKTIETKSEGMPGGVTPDSPTPNLPNKPVKIGDTWDGSAKVGGSEVKYLYKLAGVGSEGGADVATIEATASGIPGGGTFDGPMMLKLDMGTGMPVSMSMKTKSKDATGKEVVATMDMKRR